MCSVHFLILMAICFKTSISSVINYERTNISVPAIANWSMESNESTEDEIAFRKKVTESLIPSDARNLTDELSAQDMKPISHTSLLDFQNDNSTQSLLQRMRKRDKELRIRSVKEYLLLITWNNRTSNHSVSSGRTPREVGSFRQAPIDLGGIIQHDDSMLSQTEEDGTDYYDYPEEYMDDKIYWEKIHVSFEELGLDDIILAPGGVLWPVCRENSDVMPEILRRLDDPAYPLPLQVHARFTLGERFGFAVPETKPRCVPSEWKSMQMIFLYGYRPYHVELARFVPTACSCTD